MPARPTPTTTPPPGIRTPAQNRAIHGLKNQLAKASGLSADEVDSVLREATRVVSGQEHTSRLTTVQADRLIERLRREVALWTPKAAASAPASTPAQKPSRRTLAITAAQSKLVGQLLRLTDRTDLRAQREWCQKCCGKPWPTTQHEADQVIEPLSSMLLRPLANADIRARVVALRAHPRAATGDFWPVFLADIERRIDEAGDAKRVLTPGRWAKILEGEAFVAEDAS